MAVRITAMPLLTALCLGALLVHLSNGQCRTDCACARINSPPPERRCCLYISENLPPGSPVGNANDLPFIADFDATTYDFVPHDSDLGARFNFSESTGAIITAVSIDREDITGSTDGDCIGVFVRGENGGGSSEMAQFGIVIEDVNDNRPQFEASVSILNITVLESNAANTLNCESNLDAIDLRNARARDSDAGRNANVTYKVAEGHGSSLFRVINPQNPCVDNLVPMDRENSSVLYSFVLVAMDGGDPQMSSNITVIFTLEDVNDNAPVFLDPNPNISVYENASIGSVLRQFNATDPDIESRPLRYSLMPSASIPFQINPDTGELNLTQRLDVEALDDNVYRFSVLATDSNSVPHVSTLDITVSVIDVNEPAMLRPIVAPDELVEEQIPDDDLIFTIQIIDADELEANKMNMIRFISGGEYFKAGDPRRPFGDLQIFDIVQHAPIDRENVTDGIVQLSLIIEEMGSPPLEQQYQHNFTILDINDEEPSLTTTEFNYTEDSGSQGQGTSTPVRRIQLLDFVRDDDAGENGTVVSISLISVKSINNGQFTVDFRKSNALEGLNQELRGGNLQFPTPFDREVFGNALFVAVNLTDGGTPPLSKLNTITIEIMDVNDNSPIFRNAPYSFNVTENGSSDFVGYVTATDDDDLATGNGLVVYSLDETQGDYEFFTIDRYNGTIRNKQAFNRESKPSFTVYVSASDSGSPPRTASKSEKVTIMVLDINDEPPEFEMEQYVFNVNNGANVGDFVGNVVATDPDEDSTVSYRFLVPSLFFSINNVTGDITIARELSTQDSTYNLTVVAFNPGFEDLKSTAPVSVRVVEDSPFIIIIGAVSGGAALLIVAIIFVCCLILCVRQMSKTGKLEMDRNGANLNNQKPILKTLPVTNGQQRSVKFSTTVEETHYDPSGTEVIRKESNIVSGDDSPQTSLRTTGGVPNGAMSANSPEEIVDYDMSPNFGVNGDLPSHHRPQYPRHGRMTSPIMLQEELNPSEFSQSTGSVVDDRNTYNSEGEEAESTYSDAPSNFNTSIPRFGRQTVQVEEHHHPADLGRYGPPPTHPPLDIHHDLHSHLPPVRHIHGSGPHSSPGHLPELRAHNLAVLNAQYASSSHPPGVPPGAEDIRDLSINSLPRNIGHHHHHHGSIGSPHTSTPPQTRHIQRPAPPPSAIRQPPPVSIPTHSIIAPAPSNGHTNSRNYPHPLVMPEAFPSRPPSDVHRFDSFIPSFTDYGETSTYASTELNEALEFKYEAEPDFCSLTATDYGENDTEL